MKISDHEVDVVFVGAGPAALPAAIQTRILSQKLNRPLNIVMLEKRVEYQRSHVLTIHPSSFNGMPADKDLEQVVRQIKATKNIRTNDIESLFHKLAVQKGIAIRYENVTEPENLRERFKNAKVIVGADGARSHFRKIKFNNELSVDSDLQYVAMIKYEVSQTTRPMSKLKELYPTSKLMNTVASEHIGAYDSKTKTTPVTLQLFIDKKTFEGMEEADFKHPYRLGCQENLIDEKLERNIRIWLRLRSEQLKEIRVPGSEKITVTHLSVQVSKKFVKKDKDSNVTYCLLGDALMSYPFFKGYNIGLKTGVKLARAIVKSFDPKENHRTTKSKIFSASNVVEGDVHAAFREYAFSMKWLAAFEVFMARVKSLFIEVYIAFIKVSGRVPWQINKWSDSKRLSLQKT